MKAALPCVIAAAVLIALPSAGTQAQEPPRVEPGLVSKSDELRDEGPGSDPGSWWSATMVVGSPGESRGHDYLGYSWFKRSGTLEPTGFDYRGERRSVLALAYSATAN